MSVDFSPQIDDFLNAKYGEEVRSALVDIADALQLAINSQLVSVTTDLSDDDSNTAPQAKTVGDLFYNGTTRTGKTPVVSSYWDYRTVVTGNVTSFGVFDMPRNSFTACVASAFSDCPSTISSAAGIFVKRLGGNAAGNIGGVLCVDRTNNNIYFTAANESDPTNLPWIQVTNGENYWNFREVVSGSVTSFGLFDMPRNSFTACSASDFANAPSEIDGASSIFVRKIGGNALGNVGYALCIDRTTSDVYFTLAHEEYQSAIKWYKFEYENESLNIDTDAVQVYCNFEFVDGKVYDSTATALVNMSSGEYVSGTKPVPCNPSENYYLIFTRLAHGASVVFFDKYKKIISMMPSTNYTAYNYTDADGTESGTYSYIPMYTFQTPPNAAFFAFNFSTATDQKKRFCVSNVPMVVQGFLQPDMRIKKDSFLLQKKQKNICIIGPSGVMNDRRYHSASDSYIYGFQEYLEPYYNSVVSYGYSSCGYPKGSGENPSIYEYICEGVGALSAKDFSHIDEVVLIPSGVGLADNTINIGDVGTVGYISPDVTTMIGAVRGVIQYIFNSNPKCKVYVASYYKYGNAVNNLERTEEMNAKLKELCEVCGATYVDLWSECPFNYTNYSAVNQVYCIDEGQHANNEGNKAIADVFVKHLVY